MHLRCFTSQCSALLNATELDVISDSVLLLYVNKYPVQTLEFFLTRSGGNDTWVNALGVSSPYKDMSNNQFQIQTLQREKFKTDKDCSLFAAYAQISTVNLY
jgi:hypothetical protein